MTTNNNIGESPYNQLVFICTNERSPNNPRGCCLHRGGEEILKKFKEEIKKKNLKQYGIRATKSGCLDLCEDGPTLVVYGRKNKSDGIWYKKVEQSDVTEIIDSHLINGIPVERIRNKFEIKE